ncbi:PsiF family protein [Roseococcus sp. DSY-14]|uniref:PsiF family protein n=1 Tax=Roseococcus sp. DSY-14 TaxID=3369650 RepID=UPI00387B3E56
MLLRLLALLLLLAPPALAERRAPTPAQQAQHERMRACNADARSRNLAGEGRKGFMRECLRGQAPAAGTQRN